MRCTEYALHDGIETTPNEVYGVCTDGTETTPNEVYGECTDLFKGHTYEAVKLKQPFKG